MPLELDVEAGTTAVATEEISRKRCPKLEDCKAIEVDNEDEEVPQATNEWQQSTQVSESFEGPTTNGQEVDEIQTFTPPCL